MEQPNQDQSKNEVAEERGEERLPLMPALAVAFSLVAIGLGFWNMLKPQSGEVIRTLNLSGISIKYQEQAKNQALQDGLSNEQRAAILQHYQMKMNTLQQTIQEYVQSCGCNVFVQSALVGRNQEVVDITPEIMSRLEAKIPASATVAAPQQPAPQVQGGATAVNPDELK